MNLGYENQKSNVLARAAWRGDFGGREHILPIPLELNPDAFRDALAYRLVCNAALISATSITLQTALEVDIPAGEVLKFDNAGTPVFAELTATAKAGTSTLTVTALAAAIAANSVAYFHQYKGRKTVASGTAIGRATAGTGTFGPASADHEEIYFLYSDVDNLLEFPHGEAYRPGSLVKYNFLPEYQETVSVGGTGYTVYAVYNGSPTTAAELSALQTIAIAGTLTSGTFMLEGVDSAGLTKRAPVAYNANLAAIQAALDIIYGASGVVAAGTVASFTVAFTGTAYRFKEQAEIKVDSSSLAGVTSTTVTRTRKGAKALHNKLASLYQFTVGVA